MILNTDHVAHQTENLGDKPRDMLAMIIKKNDWVDNLQSTFDRQMFVDVSIGRTGKPGSTSTERTQMSKLH